MTATQADETSFKIFNSRRSNQTMQRTATRCATTFAMIKTLPLRLMLALGSRR